MVLLFYVEFGGVVSVLVGWFQEMVSFLDTHIMRCVREAVSFFFGGVVLHRGVGWFRRKRELANVEVRPRRWQRWGGFDCYPPPLSADQSTSPHAPLVSARISTTSKHNMDSVWWWNSRGAGEDEVGNANRGVGRLKRMSFGSEMADGGFAGGSEWWVQN